MKAENYFNIKRILEEEEVDYTEISHQISTSCEDSKEFREKQGLHWQGSKNIVFHCKGSFYLITTCAEKKIKARCFKKEFGSKNIRFATQEEISEIIESTIGSIPPFGFSNSNIKIFVDEDIFKNDYFIFNPALPDKSIRVKTVELKRIYANLENEIKVFTHLEERFEIKKL